MTDELFTLPEYIVDGQNHKGVIVSDEMMNTAVENVLRQVYVHWIGAPKIVSFTADGTVVWEKYTRKHWNDICLSVLAQQDEEQATNLVEGLIDALHSGGAEVTIVRVPTDVSTAEAAGD